MAVGGLDLEAGTEHPFECPGLGGRFHDHQVLFCRVSQSDRLSHNEKRPHGRPTAPTTLNVPARGSVPRARSARARAAPRAPPAGGGRRPPLPPRHGLSVPPAVPPACPRRPPLP